ncbi:ABC transporter substrate binding protein [Mesorhizobium sp. YM1C-6-2]|uniref:ABC transporter substrate-binding protein n=1 Tax=Mesorhizobium sp. YM1C-6-2 TaxID=1827501 RepID=UPI0011C49C61|nr:ABC transporter substrate binding protein [Mesorhizobium sp. YM1C-6-2]
MLAGSGAKTFADEGRSPHRVLIVYDSDSTQLAAVEIARGLRTGLNGRSPTDFEVYSEFLDSVRFPEAANLDDMAEYMLEKYKNTTLDAVVAVGPTAFTFLLDKRSAIAPRVPLFFGAVTENTLAKWTLPPDVKGIVSIFDVQQTVALARRLQPDTREAVVVYGSSPFDKWWEQTAKAALGERYEGFDIRYLSDLSIAEYGQALKELPAEDVVVLLSIYEDSAGRKFVPAEAAAKLASESGVPIYAIYDTFVGVGAVAGQVATFQDLGEQLGQLVYSELNGDASAQQATDQITRPVVDWRVAERFGINPNLLPADTEVRFREPSLWNDYRGTILATLAVLLV